MVAGHPDGLPMLLRLHTLVVFVTVHSSRLESPRSPAVAGNRKSARRNCTQRSCALRLARKIESLMIYAIGDAYKMAYEWW